MTQTQLKKLIANMMTQCEALGQWCNSETQPTEFGVYQGAYAALNKILLALNDDGEYTEIKQTVEQWLEEHDFEVK